jgi:hypothetical protein
LLRDTDALLTFVKLNAQLRFDVSFGREIVLVKLWMNYVSEGGRTNKRISCGHFGSRTFKMKGQFEKGSALR